MTNSHSHNQPFQDPYPPQPPLNGRLRESERFLQTLIASLPGIVYRCQNDPDWTLEYISDQVQGLVGYPPSDFLSGQVAWGQLIESDDRDRVWREVQSAITAHQPYSLEYRMRSRTGEQIWVWEQGQAVYGPDGDIEALEGFIMDVTERKRVEEEARRQAQLLESFWKFAPTCFAMLDRDFNFIRVNDMYAKACGREVSDFPGHNHFEFYPSDAQAIFEEVRATKTPFQILARPFVFPDHPEWGTTFWDWSLVPILDAAGEVELFVFSLNDVTDRKRAEEALRESEKRFRSLYDDNPSMYFTVDTAGTVVSANRFGAAQLGWRPEELIGRSVLSLFHEDDKEAVGRSLAAAFADPTRPAKWEFRKVRKDGTVIWVRESVRALPAAAAAAAAAAAGNGPVALIVCEDITEGKRVKEALQASEERFRTFMEYCPGPAFIKNADGQHLFANPAFEQALNLRRREWEGKTNDELFPSHIAADINRHDQQIIRDGKSLQVIEQTEQHGERRQWLVTKFLISDGQRHPALLGGIALDVTERKQLEQRLRQAEKMEALGTLAGGIAHDFNNILAAIIGYTELAMDGVVPDSRAGQNLDQVLMAGRRAKALIQQILAFSRRREPQREVLDLSKLLQEAMTLLRASIPATIAMRVDVRSSDSTVLADPTQLQQVIMNVCSNATQAMQERGGTLGLRLEEVDAPPSFASMHPPLRAGAHMRLTITDTGVGMTPEVLARIFDPFFTTKKVGEGTGLGLSASLGIVTGHGGTISVESEPGRGSTFSVYLPKLTAATDSSQGPEADRRGGSERILFVDDETALVRLAEQTLGNLGYRVTALTDPVLALGQFRSEPDAFDLVITDQTMPGMTGEALARELLRLRPSLPIILCTGFSEGMSEQAARKVGFRGLLMKPLTAAELDQAIRDALQRSTR